MSRVIALAASAAIVVAGGSALAQAARTTKSHTYDMTWSGAVVSTQGTAPAEGAVNFEAATVDGKIARKAIHGAARAVLTFHGSSPSTTKATEFDGTGSWSSVSTVTAGPNGTFTAHGTITGGTGPYKGAKGTFTATGSSTGRFFTFRRTGTIKY